MIRSALRLVLDFWVLILILAVWQLGVMLTQVNAIVMPSPGATIAAVVEAPEMYLTALASTLVVSLTGLLIGMATGVAAAIATWWSRLVSGLLTPVSIVFSSVPVVALIPILSRLFGYGTGTVLAVVAILTFFPFFVFVSTGLRALPPGADNVFTVFGASRLARLWRLALPAAMPNWAVALRITVPGSILAAMVGEFLMRTGGIGNLLSNAASGFKTEQAIGASLVATAASMLLFSICRLIENKVHANWT